MNTETIHHQWSSRDHIPNSCEAQRTTAHILLGVLSSRPPYVLEALYMKCYCKLRARNKQWGGQSRLDVLMQREAPSERSWRVSWWHMVPGRDLVCLCSCPLPCYAPWCMAMTLLTTLRGQPGHHSRRAAHSSRAYKHCGQRPLAGKCPTQQTRPVDWWPWPNRIPTEASSKPL